MTREEKRTRLIRHLKYNRSIGADYLITDEDADEIIEALEQKRWIPVSEQLPELNRPLLVTAYHRVCYAYMISESGNWGYPVFRLHEMCGRSWVQETASHEPYSTGRIDAWMYLDMPEPYKMCGGDTDDDT